ncbi:MAG: SAM-dependent methyltransferase [Spirochaetaceae bacterium]|nr:SAM-dependent methyltransferase [Spirochaetaceae bacterium]
MDKDLRVEPIGWARVKDGDFFLEIEPRFREGLLGLGGFGWVQILWWASLAGDFPAGALRYPSPYRGGPAELGLFASRSPIRPNPLCLSAAALLGVDQERGMLRFSWFDMEPGTPILDLKPYHPSADRIESPRVPAWCANWPRSVEASADFDWSAVFNF